MFKNIKIPTYYNKSISRLDNEQKGIILDNLFKYGNGIDVKITDDNVGDITELIFKDWMKIEDRRGPSHINSKTVVYYIRLYDEEEDFIKVGISKDYENRFISYMEYGYEIEILKITQFSNRADAIFLEKKELRKFLDFQYNPKKDFGGKTECFCVDIIDSIVNDSKLPSRVEENRVEESTEIIATKVATLESYIKKEFDSSFISQIYEQYKIPRQDFQEECKSFVLYRTEKSPSGKKERWEKEKTFDPKLRFRNWMKNNEKFSNRVLVNSEDQEKKLKLEEIERKKKELFNKI